ncbi:MAG: pyridoxine 5'-phosphate oxidase C-terminal domain-containing protein, partial [Henriciella sp.]
PRPSHWSGWRVNPSEIEFWLDGDNRIHERLKYIKINVRILIKHSKKYEYKIQTK